MSTYAPAKDNILKENSPIPLGITSLSVQNL